MNRFVRALGAALLLVSWGGLSAWARPAAVTDLGPRLREAVARGEIDSVQADVYWLYAVLAPENLPPQYRVDTSADRHAFRTGREGPAPFVLRCGTPTMRKAWALLERLPSGRKAEVEALLEPYRGSLRPARRAAAKESPGHILNRWIETANFSFEWDPATLTDEDGSVPPRDDDSDGIPDTVELWAAYFEASFTQMTTILNPNDPSLVFAGTPAETNRIFIVIDNIGAGIYGFTFPALPEFSGELPPAIVVNSDLSFAPLNDEGRAADGDVLANVQGAMKVTAAHELFHVVHLIYEPSIGEPGFEDDWWLEASSVWMEDEIFDQVNDYYQYYEEGSGGREPFEGDPELAGWSEFVEAGLLTDLSSTVAQIYGGAVFPKYLSQHVDGQRSMGRVWARIRGGFSALQALDDFARARGFTEAIGLPGLNGLYAGYAASNAALELEYEEGAAFGSVPIRGDTLEIEDEIENLPSLLGSTYRQGDGTGGTLRLTLKGTRKGDLPPGAWALSVVVKRPDPERVVALGAIDDQGVPSVSIASFGLGETTVEAVSFLSDVGEADSYTTDSDDAPAADTEPPTPVTELSATAVPGGLDVSWSASTDDTAVAGYGVRIETVTGQQIATRSLFGPILSVEIRELSVDTYNTAVFAYDTSGNEGLRAALEAVEVTDPAPETPTPAPEIEGQRITSEEGVGLGSSKGIGTQYGLDEVCFIQALGRLR